jgi:mono/diheme cytochrome c family protein
MEVQMLLVRESVHARRRIRPAAIVLIVLLFLFPLIVSAAGEKAAAPAKAGREIEGKRLVLMAGCNDCHTPMRMGPNGPASDMSRMLSGHPENLQMPSVALPQLPWAWVGSATMTAFSGPWGTTFAANLTPDLETGLGVWTEETFVKTIRTGKLMGTGRMIQPPMPIAAIQQASDQDLKAMFAYLKTLPAVKNQVPDYIPPAGNPPAQAPEK